MPSIDSGNTIRLKLRKIFWLSLTHTGCGGHCELLPGSCFVVSGCSDEGKGAPAAGGELIEPNFTFSASANPQRYLCRWRLLLETRQTGEGKDKTSIRRKRQKQHVKKARSVDGNRESISIVGDSFFFFFACPITAKPKIPYKTRAFPSRSHPLCGFSTVLRHHQPTASHRVDHFCWIEGALHPTVPFSHSTHARTTATKLIGSFRTDFTLQILLFRQHPNHYRFGIVSRCHRAHKTYNLRVF